MDKEALITQIRKRYTLAAGTLEERGGRMLAASEALTLPGAGRNRPGGTTSCASPSPSAVRLQRVALPKNTRDEELGSKMPPGSSFVSPQLPQWRIRD